MKQKITKEVVLNWLKTKDFEAGLVLWRSIKPGVRVTNIKALEAKLKYHVGLHLTDPLIEAETPNVYTERSRSAKPETPNAKPETPITNQQSPITNQQSSITNQQSPIPNQQSPITNQQSSIPNQQSSITNQQSPPPFIEKIIKEHSKLVKLRSQLADERLALGDANDPKTAKKRKLLTDTINAHSKQIEALYAAKENYYEKKENPDMDALFPKAKPKTPTGSTERSRSAKRPTPKAKK